jgi:hypothetical protein
LSVAFGQGAQAKASYSFAGGINSQATASGAFAYGNNNKANSDYSIALGRLTETGAMYSMAVGYNSKAQGEYSFACGHGLITGTAAGAIAFGKFNQPTYQTESGDKTYLLTIGNGTIAQSRSNIFAIAEDFIQLGDAKLTKETIKLMSSLEVAEGVEF